MQLSRQRIIMQAEDQSSESSIEQTGIVDQLVHAVIFTDLVPLILHLSSV